MTTKRHMTIQDVPFERAPDGRSLCRWCKKPIDGSKARRWCSKTCVDEYLVRSSAGVARARVFRRDKGVCAGCGLDTGRVERILKLLRQRAKGWWTWEWGFRDGGPQPNHELHLARWERAQRIAAERYRWRDGLHLWEADHIVPVAEGGGSTGLENLRTLCRACHGKESGALRKRLNAARRAQRPLPGVGP